MKKSNRLLFLMILFIIAILISMLVMPIIKMWPGQKLIYNRTVKAKPEVVVKRELKDFDSLRTSGLVSVKVNQSDKNEIIISGTKSLINSVKYYIDGSGTLRISVNPGLWFMNDGKLSITVNAANLRRVRTNDISSLELNNLKDLQEIRLQDISYIIMNNVHGLEDIKNDGACYLIAKNIKSKNLDISIDGLSIFQLDGKAERVDINGDGLGRVYADNLLVNNADVSLDGFVYVYMSVSKRLNIDYMDGLTKFTYYGKPKIDRRHIAGLSKVVEGDSSARVKPFMDMLDSKDITSSVNNVIQREVKGAVNENQ
jgi:hypothetical protein